MVFSELTFLFLFLPAVLIIYTAVPRCLKNSVLLFSSLVFYAFGEPKFLILMVFTIILHYTAAIMIDRFKEKSKNGAAKAVLIVSIIISIGLLGVFKYTDFFIENINSVLGTDISLTNLILPIGISFYTFQTLSYTVDVYRGTVKAQKNIITLGTFVALFPQLIAGPIVQYKTVENELINRSADYEKIFSGFCRFAVGLSKKVLLANSVGAVYDEISKISNMPSLTAWLGVTAFAFQIYFDFSGYSDMAIGLGKMFGFEFPENFRYPYLSTSVTEFWRRWHITLGTWFREYVYIPLGGNRVKKPRWIFNIAVVWFLTGFWHGASWNFIIWGLWFGLLLIIEKLFIGEFFAKHKIIGFVWTALCVLFGWVLFSSDTLSLAGGRFAAMFGVNGAFDLTSLYILKSNALLLLICAVGSTDLPLKAFEKLTSKKISKPVKTTVKAVGALIMVVLCVAFIAGESYNPFLYFRF